MVWLYRYWALLQQFPWSNIRSLQTYMLGRKLNLFGLRFFFVLCGFVASHHHILTFSHHHLFGCRPFASYHIITSSRTSPYHRITKSLLALGRYVRPQGEAPCTSKTFVCRRGYLRQSPITIYSTSGICILSILTNLTFPITYKSFLVLRIRAY